MSENRFLRRLKYYVVGGFIGAIVVIILGFSTGEVVSAGTMKQAVSQTRTNTLAKICAQSAMATWTSQGNAASGLKGWANSDKRVQAATAAVKTLNVSATLQHDVVQACEQQLDV